jgi:hypothetical protein
VSGGKQFCENCGTAIGETTNFCPNCGVAQRPDPDIPTGPPPPIPETGRISTPSAPNIPPPQEKTEKSKSHTLQNIIIIMGLIVVLLILIRGCGDGGGGSNKASGKTFTKDNYAELATDPASFKGASVDVEGKLLNKNPEVKGSQTSFQMWADPENHDWNTIVHTDSAPSDLSGGDLVRVTGTVKGAFKGENAFGANLTAVEVQADSVEVTKSSAR